MHVTIIKAMVWSWYVQNWSVQGDVVQLGHDLEGLMLLNIF